MMEFRQRGMSTLGVMSVAAILLIGVVVVAIIYTARARAGRDEVRLKHLEIISLAEEYYFDKHRVYGGGANLQGANLLPADVVDPDTAERYSLYLNNLNDEWCAWARSEVKNSWYFTRHEAGTGIVTNQPTNLATCKLSL